MIRSRLESMVGAMEKVMNGVSDGMPIEKGKKEREEMQREEKVRKMRIRKVLREGERKKGKEGGKPGDSES